VAGDIEVHFDSLSVSDATLVVVAVGTAIYSATNADPLGALRAVAREASTDLARRGRLIDARVIVERGREELSAVDLDPLLARRQGLT
jgi:hypothetical protein